MSDPQQPLAKNVPENMKENSSNFEFIFKSLKNWSGASADSRTIEKGNIFFALPGENADGHNFVREVLSKGASYAVVTKDWFSKLQTETKTNTDTETNTEAGIEADPRIVPVDDVLVALQEFARIYRNTFTIPVIAVTGSNGKTSTKNMIAAALATKFNVFATKGNFNSHIGLPISILSVRPEHEIAVFEIGINHPGETKFLAGITKPDTAVITGIGTAHIEFFEDTKYTGGPKEGIAHEKGEIGKALPKGGLLVLPEEDSFKDLLVSLAPQARVETVSLQSSEFPAIRSGFEKEKFPYVYADHMLQNALLAIAIGKEYGIEQLVAVQAIAHAEYEKGRFDFQSFKTKNKKGEEIIMQVIDDTYNANPDSVCAAIEAFSKIGIGKKILALGCLKEQGSNLEVGYQRIYEKAITANLYGIVFVDVSWNPTVTNLISKKIKIFHVSNHAECVEKIKEIYTEGDIVLCKGSKSAKMGEVINTLKTSKVKI